MNIPGGCVHHHGGRYVAGGRFFDEADADGWRPDGHGDTHPVIVP